MQLFDSKVHLHFDGRRQWAIAIVRLHQTLSALYDALTQYQAEYGSLVKNQR